MSVLEQERQEFRLDQWDKDPAKAHWIDKRIDTQTALCGERLLGVPASTLMPVCEDCKRIVRERYGR